MPTAEVLHEEGKQEHAKERAREKASKEERVLEEAPLLSCSEQCEEYTENAPDDRPNFCAFEAAEPFSFAPAEKIVLGGVRKAVDGPRKAAHGSGTNGCDDKARHADREAMHDKEGEHVVLADIFGKGGNITYLVVNVKGGPNPVEQNGNKAAEHHRKDARTIRGFHVLAAQVTLYKLLVATANGDFKDGVGKASGHKRACIGNIERRVPPAGFAGFRSECRHFAEATDCMRNENQHQHATAKEHTELHHVCPDDRLDAAKPGVKNGDRSRDNDGEFQVDIQNLRKHQGRSVKQNARAQKQMQAVKDCSEATHRLRAETHFEKFIGAVDARRAEPRDKNKTHHDNAQKRPDLEHQKSHVVAKDIGWRP